MLNSVPNLRLDRYLDRFYLWTAEDDFERRQEVLDGFFDLIAPEYESLINIQRNVENIRNLLGFLVQLVDPVEGGIIVDFGCGTGFSIEPASALGVQVIGVDRCPKMRAISGTRGMTVWNPEELASLPSDSLAGAFASYVLHSLAHTKELYLLWAGLKPGGVLVANFHKDQGIELVEACVRELQGTIKYLTPPAGSERHGPYIAFLKEK